jgi:hypothetical protein
MSESLYSTDLDTKLSHGDGDHERFAHYVDKAEAVRAMVEGTPVVALCGKKWVPSRDPEKFPICPTCKELYGPCNSDSDA